MFHPEPIPQGGLLRPLLRAYPPRVFDRGETVIESADLVTTDLDPPAPLDAFSAKAAPDTFVCLVLEGLVRGVLNQRRISSRTGSTAVVAGDGRWIGCGAFKYGKNIFRYVALTPTTASLIPFAYLRDEAPREVLLHALWSVSLSWCTAASVLTLGSESLARRTALLLYDMSRLHPRPEIEVRQQDIADMLGVTRQTLHPVLKALREEGILTLGYGEITIGDPAVLSRRLRGATRRRPAGRPD